MVDGVRGALLALILPAFVSAAQISGGSLAPRSVVVPAGPLLVQPFALPTLTNLPLAEMSKGVPPLAGASTGGDFRLKAEISAPAAAQTQAAAGAAIANSKSVDAALGALVQGGLLAPEKVPQDETDKLFLLKRLWDHAAPAYAEGKIAVDSSWAVPALSVKNGETTYLIHPVAHGQLYPPNKRAVAKLVRQIEKNDAPLFSEQGLPAHYAFAYGRETADHGVDQGAAISVGPAAQGVPAGALKFFHLAFVAAALTPLGLAIHEILRQPSLLSIVPAVAYAAVLLALRSGFLPFYRWDKRRDAAEAKALGAADLAEQLSREAQSLHRARLDPMEVLRLHLPPGPGAASDPFSARSAAIAAVVAAEAAASDLKVVHLLVGYKHAAEIGWRLRSQLP